MLKGNTRYHLDLIFSNLLYGANFSYFISLVQHWVPFQELFFLQVAASAIFFIPFALFSPHYRIGWNDFLRILIVTVLIIYGSMYTLLWGAKYTTPINASVISTLGPAVTLLVASWAYKKKIRSTTRIIGLILAFAGAGTLLIDKQGILVHGTPAWGNALILISVISVATNTVIIKPVLEKLGTLVVMGWYYIIGFIITAPFFMEDTIHTTFSTISLGAKFEILYILILGTILPAYLLYRGTEKLTSTHTALYRYIQPVMTTIIVTLRGQEKLDRASIIAVIIIFSGIVMSVVAYKKPTVSPPAPSPTPEPKTTPAQKPLSNP